MALMLGRIAIGQRCLSSSASNVFECVLLKHNVRLCSTRLPKSASNLDNDDCQPFVEPGHSPTVQESQSINDADTFGVLDPKFREKSDQEMFRGIKNNFRNKSQHQKICSHLLKRKTQIENEASDYQVQDERGTTIHDPSTSSHPVSQHFQKHAHRKFIPAHELASSDAARDSNDNAEWEMNSSHSRSPGQNVHLQSRAEDESTRDTADTSADLFGELVEDEFERAALFGDEKRGGAEHDDDKKEATSVIPEGLRRKNIRHWEKLLEKFLKRGMVKEAVDMLEVDCLKVRHIHPTVFMYSTVISACGKVGYADKAFKLFKNMKERGLIPNDHIYTALFNACAISPFNDDSLRRANYLRQVMFQKQIVPNQKTYHAMIKAFSMKGDMSTAFQIVDEMLEAGMMPNEETYNHLLLACLGARDVGFKYAIQVWRKMVRQRVKPTLQSYNILLGVVRLCGLGDSQSANKLLELDDVVSKAKDNKRLEKPRMVTVEPVSYDSTLQRGHTSSVETSDRDPTLTASYTASDIGSHSVDGGTQDEVGRTSNEQNNLHTRSLEPKSCVALAKMKLPNLLSPSLTDLQDVVSIGAVKTAQDRLMLLGEMAGFLKHMRKNKVQPDDRTFVKEVLALMHQHGCHPNIATFGSLATGCSKQSQALQLLQDIDLAGMSPNIEILGALIHKACMAKSFFYLIRLCRQMDKLDIAPDKRCIVDIEQLIHYTKFNIVRMEKGMPVPSVYRKPWLKDGFRTFMLFYAEWLVQTSVRVDPHPWDTYRRKEDEPVTEPSGRLMRQHYEALNSLEDAHRETHREKHLQPAPAQPRRQVVRPTKQKLLHQKARR
ncbi:PREDICTED: pentatricopeptide repeat-containing protein 1, mitochondrial-like isoform X2 [Priapulus caudatus]|uniref:Pentatricopeptide repeat-containing protein 1, mitochondrial-like isoform X2 n=1 Tax=Priapulus caudatus TaxID=37621 RepID=A0ABM1DNU4_PRICU|nr:PREDICTED: pentatricopeptide repeat-containing protein 1, mitochondrial-like isoform X2 [Priapulus caudatus]